MGLRSSSRDVSNCCTCQCTSNDFFHSNGSSLPIRRILDSPSVLYNPKSSRNGKTTSRGSKEGDFTAKMRKSRKKSLMFGPLTIDRSLSGFGKKISGEKWMKNESRCLSRMDELWIAEQEAGERDIFGSTMIMSKDYANVGRHVFTHSRESSLSSISFLDERESALENMKDYRLITLTLYDEDSTDSFCQTFV